MTQMYGRQMAGKLEERIGGTSRIGTGFTTSSTITSGKAGFHK